MAATLETRYDDEEEEGEEQKKKKEERRTEPKAKGDAQGKRQGRASRRAAISQQPPQSRDAGRRLWFHPSIRRPTGPARVSLARLGLA